MFPVSIKSCRRGWNTIPGRKYAHLLSAYTRADDADYLVIIMSSATGVVKDVVDSLRERGIKAGCLRVRLFARLASEELAVW